MGGGEGWAGRTWEAGKHRCLFVGRGAPLPPDVGPSCSGELRGLDIQERGTLEWGKVSGYCIGLLHSYCSAPPTLRRPSPQEYHQNCKEGLLGAWSGVANWPFVGWIWLSDVFCLARTVF